jgi:serine/threonine protein kinase
VIAANSIVGGRYRVIKLLGGGGMKQVYLVEDLRLAKRPCAMAEMIDNFADPDMQRQASMAFHREADMLAKLDNQHVPRVYDNFSEQNRHYLVMECVEGITLEEKLTLNGGTLTEDSVVEIALQIVAALEYLHGLKPSVVYRDLKPSNVMVTPAGLVKLVDFGIARYFQPLKTATAIGTQGYAAPEQYRGKAEARSDLYALGATMHHLLSGRDPAMEPPFSFPPIEQLLPKCNPLLANLINDALAYKPGDRPANAAEFRQRLTNAKIGVPPISAVDSRATAQDALTRPVALKARHPRFGWMLVGLFGVVTAVALGTLVFVDRTNPEHASETAKATSEAMKSSSFVLPTPEAASSKAPASAEDLEREASLHLDDANVLLRLGRAWLLRAKSDDTSYQKALDAYGHALVLAPNNLYALHAVGYINFHEKKYRQAIAVYERYFAHGGDDPDARLRLAAAYLEAGIGYEAISQCKAVLAQEPSSFRAEFTLGLAYDLVRNYPQARAALRKASDLAPDERARTNIDKLFADVDQRLAALKAQKARSKVALQPSSQPPQEMALPQRTASPPPQQTEESGSGYFIIGSTKEQVLAVQGTPSEIHNYSFISLEVWGYGFCSVEFKDGQVDSYDSHCGRLHVRVR